MALFMIGLGLSDETDITVKGLALVRKSDFAYLESYTSHLNVDIHKLEQFYGKKITKADRRLVEIEAERTILERAKTQDVSFLVVGDVFSATTHVDLYLRAQELDIPVTIVHNASVMTAIGVTGLQLYKFGKTTSIPFANENVQVPYDVIKANQQQNLHTLLLLDLTEEPGNSMTVGQAIRYLLKIEMKRNEQVFLGKTLCVGCAKLGSKDQIIKAGSANKLLKEDFKKGLHCLIVPAQLHFMEEDALKMYR